MEAASRVPFAQTTTKTEKLRLQTFMSRASQDRGMLATTTEQSPKRRNYNYNSMNKAEQRNTHRKPKLQQLRGKLHCFDYLTPAGQ